MIRLPLAKAFQSRRLLLAVLGTLMTCGLLFGAPAWVGISTAQAQQADPLLAATPDANAADPLIIAKAAELGNDPQLIFAFVRDEIRFEAYRGSLRGARGTLWSSAGNALDQSNLLVALLRASGVRAQYARGVLTDELAADLIESMFPPVCRVVGELSEDSVPADPASDPQLLAETRDHVWVEFEDAGGFTAADPSFGTAQPGDFLTVADERFAEVPAGLRHSVTVRLNIEQISAFGLAAGLDQTLTAALEANFVTAELVGVPLSLSHLVNTVNSGGLIFSNRTHTYTPLLVVGEGDDTPLDDETIQGTDYQELFTNFPLGSQFLTGVFLDVELKKPGGNVESLRHTLLDRIGFAARRFGGSGALAIDAGAGPALNGSDVFTLSVIPGHSGSDLTAQETLLESLAQRADELAPVVQSLPADISDPDSTATVQEAMQLSREIGIATTRVMNDFFFLGVGVGDAFLETRLTVASYLDSPRVVVSGLKTGGDAQNPELAFSMNILRDPVRVVPLPQQAEEAAKIFHFLRVVQVDQLEGVATTLFTEGEAVTAIGILGAAADQGIGLKLVDSESLPLLDQLDLSADSKARITEAVLNGQFVMTPQEPVLVGGKLASGWLEFDEQTGVVVGRLEDGSGGALFEYFNISNRTQEAVAPGLGVISAIGSFVFGGFAAVLADIPNAIKKGAVPTAQDIKLAFLFGGTLAAWETYREALNSFFFFNVGPRLKFKIAYLRTMRVLIAGGAFAWAFFDPPVPDILMQAAPCAPDAEPGLVPGVAVTVGPDGVLTIPSDGAQLPSAFLANVRNLGPETDSFALTFPDVPPGFAVTSSLGTVTIPAGAAGEIGLYLKPIGPLPAAGTTVSFTVVATSTSDPAVTASALVTFVVPGVRGVLVTLTPERTSAEPGTPVPATLTLTSVGNVDEVDVALDLSTIGDVAVVGLLSPVSLLQGETVTQALTLTPAVAEPVNSTVSATVTATFGTDLVGAPATADGGIAIELVPDAAGAAVEAADAARDLGRDGLAGTLEAVSASMTALITDPLDAAEQARLLALLDSLIEQVDASGLVDLAQRFAEIRDALAIAGPDQVALEVERLGDPLRGLAAYLTGPARTEFALSLLPDSAVAQPGTPLRFDLSIVNNGLVTATYEPSVQGLPLGFTAQFNRDSVTLSPGQSTGGAVGELFLTLAPPVDELLPFDFTVSVLVAGVDGAERSVQGSVTLRNTTVRVVDVTATPNFVDPGQPAAISAKLLNIVNRPNQVELSFRAVDQDGIAVFESAPVTADLSVLASLDDVSLGNLDTTGLPLGPYTIEATVVGSDGAEIPGAAGEGNLFVGAPLTAGMRVIPDILPPGDGAVDVTLDIQSLVDFPDPSINLVAQVDTFATATSLAINGNIAYVCGTEDITIIDIADPANPQILGSFAGDLIAGSGFAACRVVDGHLIVMWQVTLDARALTILVFRLDDPVQPTLRRRTSANARFLSSLFFKNRFAYTTTRGIIFGRFSGTLFNQFGDFVSYDFTNLDNPFLLDALLNLANRPNGGAFNMHQAVPFNDNFAFVATTTSSGSAGQSGIGRVLTVDISNPANLTTVHDLRIPGTVHATGVGFLGDVALFAGNTQGRNTTNFNFALTGNVTLSTVDVSDPANPILLNTLVTDARGGGSTTVNSLGNGFFSVSGTTRNGRPVLMVVDANDPLNIAFNTIDTPSVLQESLVIGNTLFAPSAAGLGIYDIGNVVGTRFSARVDVPTGSGVVLDPGSFTIPPTQIISGAGFDTVVWERTLNGVRTAESLGWNASVLGLQAGEARDVVLGATVDFTAATGETGHIALPPLTVVSDQILALTPASRTVAPLQEAAYILTVKNPTALTATYDLDLGGVPDAWTAPLPSVSVPAAGSVDVAFSLRPDLAEGVGANEFFVTAIAGNGTSGAVFGEVVVDAAAPGPVSEDIVSQACGVLLAVAPSGVTAGQGGEALYTVEVTNVGDEPTDFVLATTPPAGFTAQFETSLLTVPPGLSSKRQTDLRVAVPSGTAAGTVAVPVAVQAQGDCTASALASANLDVAEAGVATALTPPSGTPETVYQLTVTNLGATADSFDIALAGALAPYYTLSTNVVSLAAGASTTVNASRDTNPPAQPGTLQIIAAATSQSVPEVRDSAAADVVFPATLGVAAVFEPALIELELPGPGRFAFNIENTGNVENRYIARIASVTGTANANATFRDLDGSPVTQTQPFLVPGLGSASVILDAELLTFGDSDSTAEVTSQLDPLITDAATARLRTINVPPIADAGPDASVAIGRTVFLDGQASVDPDGLPAPLSFQWSFLELPANSGLLDTDIQGNTTAAASFTPDVSGLYRLELDVFDGLQSGQDEVAIAVTNELPIAKAGRDQFAAVGDAVVLNGSNSFDPEQFLITYEWSLVSAPATSSLDQFGIDGVDRPKPSFVPDVEGTYQLQLVVRDNELESLPDLVDITAVLGNVPPNAIAKVPGSGAIGVPVPLDGTASVDPDDGPGPLGFAWSFGSKPPATLLTDGDIAGRDTAAADFVPDEPGAYDLELEVSDGLAADLDTGSVVVAEGNAPPNADAGPDRTAIVGVDTATFDGSASSDPDDPAESLGYLWRLVSRPADSLVTSAEIQDSSAPIARLFPDVVGSYVLALDVTDAAATDFDHVLLAVAPDPCAETGDQDNDGLGDPTDDRISGTKLDDTLYGGAGNDIIAGKQGSDTLFGGSGDDRITGGQGPSLLYGGSGNDVMNGQSEDDTLFGGTGDDHMNGSMGNDLLCGGDGADFLTGEIGNDTLVGGAGDDYVEGGVGADVLDGRGGVDNLSYNTSAAGVTIDLANGTASGADAEGDTIARFENIEGSLFDDSLTGDAGANVIKGEGGADILRGGGGGDTLFSDGDDLVQGGDGGGWIDTIHLEGVAGGPNVGGWSIRMDSGQILQSNLDNLVLSDDSAGAILYDSGAVTAFDGIERVVW